MIFIHQPGSPYGKWKDSLLVDTLKAAVIQAVYSQTRKTGKLVFCIMDDSISSKT